MKRIKFILKAFWEALKYILYRWLIVLIAVIKNCLRKCMEYKNRKRNLTRRERREYKGKCAPINSNVYHRPDPCIYSQHYLMKQGLAVTWDNPDIQLKKNGIPVSSKTLELDTEYEIEARIWNNSTEAPVFNMPVKFSYLSFGAGTVSTYIGETTVSVGVKGGANHPAFAKVLWRTPAAVGHYCIQTSFQWSDDANPDNNLGQENTNVQQASSPAYFQFQLRNDRKRKHHFRFEVDTYRIPKKVPCREVPKSKDERRSKAARMQWMKQRHQRANFPIPDGWTVAFEPEELSLAVGAEATIKATIIPPDNFIGVQHFNVNGFDDRNNMLGGVTLYVEKKA